ncbi:MAG: glycosyltransferase family 4 protein, partial [Verrucomicrobia bacterium]|nr:glycosyltransferase family 4 protein [Verrucomicrobiota bacterium]
MMRIAHLLRKYNPAEWGGTESALLQLCRGLRLHGVSSVVFCPHLPDADLLPLPARNEWGEDRGEGKSNKDRPPLPGPLLPSPGREGEAHGSDSDPLAQSGCSIKRYHSRLPIWGIPEKRKGQLIAIGGNLVSFDLIGALWREPDVSLIHTHALGRLGGVALTVARRRRVPIVLTIHGGLLDLPPQVRNTFNHHAQGGWDWGKIFGAVFKARRLVEEADVILTCNPREAQLLQQKHPGQRIQVHPHGVIADRFRKDYREAAREAFPMIRNRQVLLAVGRIDPPKNQAWLVEQAPEILRRHDRAILVLAGACTDEAYGAQLNRQIEALGLKNKILRTGGLPPADGRLIGLYQ